MENNFQTTRNGSTNDALKSTARDAGRATEHVGNVTQKAAEQVGTAARDEMVNLKSDLDDLISRIPNLSEVDLNAAKDKLLQKFNDAKVSANGTLSVTSARFRNLGSEGCSTGLVRLTARTLVQNARYDDAGTCVVDLVNLK